MEKMMSAQFMKVCMVSALLGFCSSTFAADAQPTPVEMKPASQAAAPAAAATATPVTESKDSKEAKKDSTEQAKPAK